MARTDLNLVRILMAVADAGSFQRAAAILGADHNTVGRKIAQLEKQAGVALFQRRSTGVQPTEAGRRLLTAAERVSSAMDDFDRVLITLRHSGTPVTIAAPEGLSSYLLVPQTVGGPVKGTPVLSIPSGVMPRMIFLPGDQRADITILAVSPGDDVPCSPDYNARKLGLMRFKPVAARTYLQTNGTPESMAEMARHPLLSHVGYEILPSFRAYADLTHSSPEGPLMTLSTSSALHRAVMAEAGIGLLPDFSNVLDPQVVVLPFEERMAVEVWLVAHPDTLRLPSVRQAYDGIAAAFHGSAWFRE
ncbi:LysR family transcriptional regulator [Azospirillum sp.]|uniref:LysR family transcriptional regulator n=1 Tax=Azospirillum sp. TaxID=34012 RepID=UPI002D62C481|nr:LysR family transcriptional regulator [Azospirillum sp.]HYD68057.1 LysR family transcriptional regulator [Azospirillum sp.]